MDIPEGGDNVNLNKVEQAKQNLESTTITDDNYDEVIRTWSGYNDIILAQLENYRMDYDDYMNSYNQMKESDDFKNATDHNVVPLDTFKQLVLIVRIYKNIVSWQNLKMNYDEILIGKMKEYMKNTNQKKLIKDTWTVLNEERKEVHEHFRKTLEEKDAFTKDIINTKVANIEESLNNRLNNIVDKMQYLQENLSAHYNNDRKEMLDVLSTIISKIPNADLEEVKHKIDQSKNNGTRLSVDDDSLKHEKQRPRPKPEVVEDDDDDDEVDTSQPDYEDDDENQDDEEPEKEEPKPKPANTRRTTKTMQDIQNDYKDFEVD